MGHKQLTPLGEEIQKHLDRTGWSQRGLASKAELAHSAISKIMRGKTNPTPSTINAIGQALNVDPMHLMRLAGIPVSKAKRNPSVEYVAQRLDNLPSNAQVVVISAINALIDAMISLYEKGESRGQGGAATAR